MYYLASALTLPWANAVWLGEIPLLGLVQLPKAVLKYAVHKLLLHAVAMLGITRGSYSPDYLMTHAWALAIMLSAPAMLLVGLFLLIPQMRNRRRMIAMMLALASCDALVTLWYEHTASLKLFNGSYF